MKVSPNFLLIPMFLLGYLVGKFYYKHEIKKLSRDLDQCGIVLMNFNKEIVSCNARLSFCGIQVQQLLNEGI